MEEDLVAPPSSLRLGDAIYERLQPAEVTKRGPFVGKTERRVPDNIDKTGYDWLEGGDSNHLKPGTPVYAAKGYDPAFRVVARGDEGWTLYEVAANRSAARVAELLDVGGRTVRVSIKGDDRSASAEADPFRGVGETTAFVDAVLGTPLVRVSADYSYVGSLVFTLEDGTQTACFYEPDSGELYLSEEDPFLGVVLPEKLREDLRRAP